MELRELRNFGQIPKWETTYEKIIGMSQDFWVCFSNWLVVVFVSIFQDSMVFVRLLSVEDLLGISFLHLKFDLILEQR